MEKIPMTRAGATALETELKHLKTEERPAIITDDIDKMEQAVLARGFQTSNHGDYEPGRRFYFHDADNIEFEVVQYD